MGNPSPTKSFFYYKNKRNDIVKFYSDFVTDKSKIKKIEEILFEMGLTTDLVVEGVNDRYKEGLEKLKEIGEYRLAKAVEEKQIFFNI